MPEGVQVLPVSDEAIARAAERLRQGGLVAFPTETVYGLGALARDPAAVRRIFAAKGRPADHPLIVHLAGAGDLGDWAEPSPLARHLAETFWPGPLTLVLPRRPAVCDEVTGGQASVALRVPAHPAALRLIEAAGALAAPSANRFGGVSPTRAADVVEELGAAVDLVLDGGPCGLGLESTILSLMDARPLLLRPGGLTVEQLEEAIGAPIDRQGRGPRAPGGLPAHYAPATPLEVLPAAALWQRAARLSGQDLAVAVAVIGPAPERLGQGLAAVVEMPREAVAYGRRLYATLRDLDRGGCDRLLFQAPPAGPAWLAVRDRLRRAACRHLGTSASTLTGDST
jgi:L-threonylcarbamoyladenylate synthase